MATGAKITGSVTRWWWVRHAPVPNPERRCYGQSDKDCDVSNEELFRHQAKPEFVYRHVWQQGTLLLWDNRCLVHAATGGYQGHRRLLHRITVGERTPG